MLCQGVDKSFSCARTDSAQDSSVCCNNVTHENLAEKRKANHGTQTKKYDSEESPVARESCL